MSRRIKAERPAGQPNSDRELSRKPEPPSMRTVIKGGWKWGEVTPSRPDPASRDLMPGER